MHLPPLKPLTWIGSSLKDLKACPDDIQDEVGHALREVQAGLTPYHAKPLKGFGGTAVMEIIARADRNTYRAVYTARFAGRVYVLHVFHKKAKHGIATPQADIDLIWQRYQDAEADHTQRHAQEEG